MKYLFYKIYMNFGDKFYFNPNFFQKGIFLIDHWSVFCKIYWSIHNQWLQNRLTIDEQLITGPCIILEETARFSGSWLLSPCMLILTLNLNFNREMRIHKYWRGNQFRNKFVTSRSWILSSNCRVKFDPEIVWENNAVAMGGTSINWLSSVWF